MVINLLIILFVLLSYISGLKSILENKYRPSIYSRVIWLILVINNFISVLVLKNDLTVLILAGMALVGNLMIFIFSLKKSETTFGKTEFISSILIFISLGLWVFTRLPLLNLMIGIVAHFIGGIPTYIKVVKNPRDEDLFFWLYFFLASILALINIDQLSVSQYLYPLYFLLLNGGMTLLCLRRFRALR